MSDQIVFHKVRKRFRGVQVLAVDDIHIARGEIVALVGKNGAGKSTFIKIASGLLLQDTGTVTVFDVPNTCKNIHRIVQFVLESGGGYYQYLTAKQNIEYFLKLNHCSYKEKREQIAQLERLFDFEPFHTRLVSELSQGNRQKLALIVALLCDASVLCLDEPTNGLDAPSTEKLAQLLGERARREGLTVLCTTHDTEFIRQCVTRLIALKQGCITADASLGDLGRERLQNLEVRYVITLCTDELRRHRQNLPLFEAALENDLAQIVEEPFAKNGTNGEHVHFACHVADRSQSHAFSRTISVITTVRKEVMQELICTCDVLTLTTNTFEVEDLLERLLHKTC